MADKRSHATDPAQLRQIPAVNGTRVGSPGTRRARGNRALSDCVSIMPDGQVKVFRALNKSRKIRVRPEVIEVRDFAHLQAIRKTRRI